MEKVAVLLSTYNGEKYLAEQISSILRQKNVVVDLYIRDDSSHDHTKTILEEYKKKYENIFLFLGERNFGYGKSFLELVSFVESDYDYYAFSDQDDFWEDNKLHLAIDKLKTENKNKLYFSNLKVVDSNLSYIKEKSFDKMSLTLESAFVRNRTAGCTYVFDNVLFKLLKSFYKTEKITYIEHDALIYKLCLATEGTVIYDRKAKILYRQHEHNVTGVNQGFKERIKKELLYQFDSNKKRNLMKKYSKNILNFIYNNNIKSSHVDFLKKCSNYDKSLRDKTELLFYPNFSSGVLLFDLKNKIEIIFNLY